MDPSKRKPRGLHLDQGQYRALTAGAGFLTTPQTVELLVMGYDQGQISLDPADAPDTADAKPTKVGMGDDAFALLNSLTGNGKQFPNPSALVRALIAAHLAGTAVIGLYATDKRKAPRSTPTLTAAPDAEQHEGT